jgi:hypothetical protein
MGLFRVFGVALAICAFATIALAERWVKADSPWWLDLDSIRQEGAITAYVVTVNHSDSPPNLGDTYNKLRPNGVDCATGERYELKSGSWTPDTLSNNEPYYVTDRVFQLVCNR